MKNKTFIAVFVLLVATFSVATFSLPVQAQDVETRIIDTVNGELEVPVDPQRVVVNWYVAEAFTLNLPVAGYSAWANEAMPFYDRFAETTLIENWEAEDILALDPDLIITYSQDDYENFSMIAPVLVIPEGRVNSVERLALIAEATGREAEAAEAILTFEVALAKAKLELTSDAFADSTFSIFQDWGASSYGIYYESDSRGGTLMYTYLGLQQPEKLVQLIEESGAGRGSLSYEVAAEYFGDYIVWFLMEDYESEFAQTEIWQSIPAVREGRIISIPGELLGLFYYSDVTSLTAQLDYLTNALNELVAE